MSRPEPTSEPELVRAAMTGSEQARLALVEAFTPRIRELARTYDRAAGIPAGELVRESADGLLHALDRYDPDWGTPFWTYASWWVRHAMRRCGDGWENESTEVSDLAARRQTIGIVWKWFLGLSDRESTIVYGRYRPDAPRQTLGQLGARLDMSAEGVRGAERRALARLHLPAAHGRRLT